MGFVKKTTPPPECEEGDIFKAKLMEIKKVTGQYKDDDGNLKEQLEIHFELENGYRSRAWIAYYEQPGDKSALGKLALKLQQVTKREINNIDEFLTAFKGHGQVFVQVKSFRHYEGESFPNFAVVKDKLPGLQEKLSIARSEEKAKNMKPVLEPFADAIIRGIPLNQQDWNKSLQVSDRLALFKQGIVTEKEGLYYFTDKARDLLRNEV